ncbi:MAG: aminoglycoside adenylyltransferase domain-containing protein [Kibdelosporangium sp.]
MKDVVDTYLALVDAEAEGLVQGLYLEGSIALGDYRPGVSDIDYVAVTESPPDPATIETLRRVHDRLRGRHRRPYFDGVYLTWHDLEAGPGTAIGRPGSHEGRFGVRADSTSGPVTWHTLAGHGVVCRGPAIAELDIWTDPGELATWQKANLDEYWGRLLARAARLPSKTGLFALTDYAVVWTVTGVSRLHHTLATGEITSKDGAGRHALEAFPARWQRIVRESLRIRRGEPGPSLYRDRFTRRRDLLAFAGMAIAAAHRLPR